MLFRSPERVYTEYKNAAQERVAGEQQQTLDRVLGYTMETLSIYMSESDMNTLCEHIRTFQFADEQACDKIDTFVAPDSKLHAVDIMHFGWNIGNQFKKSRTETSLFLKRVFARTFDKYEKPTIKSKLRTRGGSIIKLQNEI